MKRRIAAVVLAGLLAGPVAAGAAVVWDESINGDIVSDLSTGPTFILSDGVNEILGTTSFQGNGNSTYTSDVDWFYLTIPDGANLVAARVIVSNGTPFTPYTLRLGLHACRITVDAPGFLPDLVRQGSISSGGTPCATSYVAPGATGAELLDVELWTGFLPLGAGTYGLALAPYIGCSVNNSGGLVCGGSSDFRLILDVRTNPTALLESMLTLVAGSGPGTSLVDKLNAVKAYLAVPDAQSACAMLRDFKNQVRAQRGKKLTLEQADRLTADADALMTSIGCQ